ncbi:MAG: hypothetical protein WC527_06015 [Candidatus Margulisiibacteriota bacterium]
MATGMDIQKVADIKKVDFSVAANFETVGPKRNATAISNAQREVITSQAKSSERAQSIAISPSDAKVAEALQWLTSKRPDQLTDSLTSRDYVPSAESSFAVNAEMNRLGRAAETLLMAAQAKQKMQERLMRIMMNLDS